jgi:calcineurin-like phosphoesterase family protein
VRYLIADLHLGHEAALEYADRPFASVAEMDERLVDGWNAVVEDDDEVLLLGDFAVPSEPTTVRRWLRRLRGEVVLVAGDHDAGARRCRAATVREASRFEAGGHRIRCVHDPEDAPADRDGWLVHGHHHDLRPEAFPFVDPEARRVNVSAELVGYEPLPVDELVDYLDAGRRLERRP